MDDGVVGFVDFELAAVEVLAFLLEPGGGGLVVGVHGLGV